MSYEFVFLLMIFCHIVDDFYLQGWLASAKQKRWWEKNAPQLLYEHDYIAALVMHSTSWSFMILLPIAINMSFNVDTIFLILFASNAIIHGVTDHLKANKLKINLIADQIIHFLQIVGSFIVFINLK